LLVMVLFRRSRHYTSNHAVFQWILDKPFMVAERYWKCYKTRLKYLQFSAATRHFKGEDT